MLTEEQVFDLLVDVMMDIGPREIRELSREEIFAAIEQSIKEDGYILVNCVKLFANKAYEAGRMSVPNLLTCPAPK